MDDILGRIDAAADLWDDQKKKRRQARPRSVPATKCTARKKSGEPCGHYAILGGNVCRHHGGGAPQVKKAAKQRLAELVDPSIKVMAQILRAKPSARNFIRPSVQVTVAKDILDRNGMKPKDEVVFSAEFDPTQFALMSDEEVHQLLLLARKASTLRDVHETQE